jgi:hypothetical protein
MKLSIINKTDMPTLKRIRPDKTFTSILKELPESKAIIIEHESLEFLRTQRQRATSYLRHIPSVAHLNTSIQDGRLYMWKGDLDVAPLFKIAVKVTRKSK